MGDEARKKDLHRYRTRLMALAHIQQRRSAITVEIALRQGMHAARARAHEIDLHIAHLKRIQRDAYVVLATGLISCIGSLVVTSAFARAGGYAFQAGRFATTTVTTMQHGMRVVAPGGMTVPQMIAGGAIQWVVVGLPTGAVLRHFTGAHGLDAVIDLMTDAPAALSPEALRRLRDDLTVDGVGDAAFQRLLRDPNALPEQVKEAIQAQLKSDIAAEIAEEIMVMDEPIKLVMVMSEVAFSQLWPRFNGEVEALVARTLPNLGSSERRLVVDTVIYETLNDLRVQLWDWDQRWRGRIAQFKREEQALTFAPLTRESDRHGWARPR